MQGFIQGCSRLLRTSSHARLSPKRRVEIIRVQSAASGVMPLALEAQPRLVKFQDLSFHAIPSVPIVSTHRAEYVREALKTNA